MATILLFVLEVQYQGVQVEVSLNGIQVFTNDREEGGIAQVKLNPWIVEGDNQLRVLIGRGREITTDTETTVTPMFKFRIIKGEHDREPGEEGLLADYEWQPDESPLNFGIMATVWEQDIDIDSAFGRWSWQDSPKGTLSVQDRDAILALVSETHDALANRDVDRLSQLMEMKTDEMSRALGISSQTMEDGQRRFWNFLFENPAWFVEPVNFDSLTLIPQSEGCLVVVKDTQGEPPLRGFTQGRTVAFNLIVSCIERRWRIVR